MTDEQVALDEAVKAEAAASGEAPAKKGKTKPEGPVCSVCGKPLTDPESVKRGIGPQCFANGYTPESVAARMAELKSETVPEGWIKIAEMHTKLVGMGIPVARMVRAIGGDRAMEEPLNLDFVVKYVGRTRWISPAALSEANLALLNDPNLGVPKPPKAPKPPKLDADGNPIPPKAKAPKTDKAAKPGKTAKSAPTGETNIGTGVKMTLEELEAEEAIMAEAAENK